MKRFFCLLLAIVILCAGCASRFPSSESSSSQKLESMPQPQDKSTSIGELPKSANSSAPSTSSTISSASAADFNSKTYSYDNIPSFPIKNIAAEKLFCKNNWMGEQTTLVDKSKIDTVIQILHEIEIYDEKLVDASSEPLEESDHRIAFYEHETDDKPAYILRLHPLSIEIDGKDSGVFKTKNEQEITLKYILQIEQWNFPS